MIRYSAPMNVYDVVTRSDEFQYRQIEVRLKVYVGIGENDEVFASRDLRRDFGHGDPVIHHVEYEGQRRRFVECGDVENGPRQRLCRDEVAGDRCSLARQRDADAANTDGRLRHPDGAADRLKGEHLKGAFVADILAHVRIE